MDIMADKSYPVRSTDTVLVFEGVVEGTDERVRFGVDHRMAWPILEAIDLDGEALCVDVPAWSILGTVTA